MNNRTIKNYEQIIMVVTMRKGNILFNDTLNTFYIRLYGVLLQWRTIMNKPLRREIINHSDWVHLKNKTFNKPFDWLS